MNGWTLTRVWQVDHKLVIAKTIEDAIALFKTYMGENYKNHKVEPNSVRAIEANNCITDYDALIKEKYTWKPSEEQMRALKAIVDEHFDIDGGELYNLYNDLKKLIEE